MDVLVNNAGSAVRGPLMLSPLEDLSDTLDLNVKATVLLTRLLAPRIARRGSGETHCQLFLPFRLIFPVSPLYHFHQYSILAA